jgi:lambda repressor-like predicted transcriptional regulator
MKQSGWSQRRLSRETGISLPTVNAMVNGQREYLTVIEEKLIADALGVAPEELYYQGSDCRDN